MLLLKMFIVCIASLLLSCENQCRYLLEVGQVATVPGDAFGAPDCIRISYAASMQDLEKAMSRLSTVLKKVSA